MPHHGCYAADMSSEVAGDRPSAAQPAYAFATSAIITARPAAGPSTLPALTAPGFRLPLVRRFTRPPVVIRDTMSADCTVPKR